MIPASDEGPDKTNALQPATPGQLDLGPGQWMITRGSHTEFFTIGALARALNRKPVTLRKWGNLPGVLILLDHGHDGVGVALHVFGVSHDLPPVPASASRTHMHVARVPAKEPGRLAADLADPAQQQESLAAPATSKPCSRPGHLLWCGA